MCSLITSKVQFDDVRAWIISSETRVSSSLFQNLISTEDLLVKTDCCLDCYKQSSGQDSSAVLASTTARSY